MFGQAKASFLVSNPREQRICTIGEVFRVLKSRIFRARHIRHTYIRMGEKLVWIRQPGRNDDAARPVDPEKERAPRWWSEFCSPGFPSPTQDACGPHGGNEHTRRAIASDGVHSPR